MRRRSKIAEILFITVPEDALRLVEIFASKSNFGLRFKADEEKMFILGLAIQKNGSLIIINAAAAAELLIIFNFYLVVPEGNYSRRFERDNAGEANGPDTLCIIRPREAAPKSLSAHEFSH
jgi:hypothetical protein